MSDPAVRSECDRSRRPDLATPGQRAQGRSGKAAGLRVSGACLTGPSTLAFSFTPGARPKPLSATAAVCPIYWWQNIVNQGRPGLAQKTSILPRYGNKLRLVEQQNVSGAKLRAGCILGIPPTRGRTIRSGHVPFWRSREPFAVRTRSSDNEAARRGCRAEAGCSGAS